jgi:hypothetical protein
MAWKELFPLLQERVFFFSLCKCRHDLLPPCFRPRSYFNLERVRFRDQKGVVVRCRNGYLKTLFILRPLDVKSPSNSPQKAKALCLYDVDTLTDSAAKSELMMSVKGRELSERLLVSGVCWREPSVGVELLWVWINFWIAGHRPFHWVHPCTFGQEISVIDAVLLELMRNAFTTSAS